jgi:AmmeMemoRadiSam system protein B
LSIRRPCQAGSFYSSETSSLREEIEECFLNELGPGKIPEVSHNALTSVVGLVAPHAGYVYSGSIAAHSYFSLAINGIPDCVIIIGPNHTGLGSGISIMDKGIWVTPLGEISIDADIANQICRNCDLIDIDEKAHQYEHSIEVQIPFLQYLYGEKLLFVPISMMMQDLETSIELGKAIARSIYNKNIVVIASSDMSHYEAGQLANRKDKKAINAILKFDEVELFKIVESERVSMCGYGPIISTIICSKKLGASKAELLSYKTSGDVTGDHSSVVGYASLIFKR